MNDKIEEEFAKFRGDTYEEDMKLNRFKNCLRILIRGRNRREGKTCTECNETYFEDEMCFYECDECDKVECNSCMYGNKHKKVLSWRYIDKYLFCIDCLADKACKYEKIKGLIKNNENVPDWIDQWEK